MSERRPVSHPGRAAAGAAGAAAVAAATVIAVWAGHKHPGLLPSCDMSEDIFSAGPIRDDAVREWGDRWAIVTLAAAAPFGFALSTWLRAVWPERKTDVAVGIVLAGTVALAVGQFAGIADELAIAFLVQGVLWAGATLAFGVIGTAILAAVLVAGVAARKPSRRYMHWILLVLVLSGWTAIAFSSLVFSDSTLC